MHYHFAATGQRNPVQPDFRRALFRGIASDRDRVAGLERVAGPPEAAHTRRSAGNRVPILQAPASVSYIKENQRMRIGPVDFRHGSFEGDGLGEVIPRAGVMSDGAARNESREQKESRCGTCSTPDR